jgi:hypothetical protein
MSGFLVAFLCNDDRGNFTERVSQVQIGEDVHLVCATRPPVMRWVEQHVQIGRRFFRCGPRQVWLGNVFWDGAALPKSWARELVAHLLSRGWLVEQHALEGPFADLLERI